MAAYPISLPAKEPLLTVTNPKEHLWIIELHNGQDNRLTTTLIKQGLMPAFDLVEKHWREQCRAAKKAKDKEGVKGALIIVGRKDQDKFFSNGLDFASIVGDMNFFPSVFNPFLARLLAFPIPTIAAVNGHCFAGGFMLSLACDYRVITDGSKRNTWMCMNEVLFGATMPLSFAAIVRSKFGEGQLQRKMLLEAHRFTPPEALKLGIVDHIVAGGTNEVLAKAEQVAEGIAGNAREGVWGLIKNDLYRDVFEAFARDLRPTNAQIEDAAAKARL
jgi:enoyl-CoA hydratase/carnithine racemase